ncbi:MAG: hypothetical protein AAGF98_00225 [Cyanobacteria bacterium P01_H01_bin.153]
MTVLGSQLPDAYIKGVWADGQSRADDEYLILKADGSEFVMTDGNGLHNTGESVVIEYLKAHAGEVIQARSATRSLAGENLTERLQQIAMVAPSKTIYLTGTLTMDYPEGIALQPPGRTYSTAMLTGDSFSLELHPLDLGVLQLSDQ